MCERVIDEGMLAGSTEAEVDTWSAKMVVLPQPVDYESEHPSSTPNAVSG